MKIGTPSDTGYRSELLSVEFRVLISGYRISVGSIEVETLSDTEYRAAVGSIWRFVPGVDVGY